MRYKMFPGLAVLFALALLVVPALASASGGVEAEEYPAALQIARDEGVAIAIGGFGPPITRCAKPTLFAVLTGPSSSINGISGMECQVEGEGASHKLNWNGCRIELHPGSENSFDIGPPGCGPVTGLPIAYCGLAPVEILPQTGLPATYEDIVAGGRHEVKVKIHTNLEFATLGSCKGKKLEFEAHWVVGGTFDIWSTDGHGLYIAGHASENEAEQPKFNFEAYPGSASGSLESASGQRLTLGFGSDQIICKNASFSTQSSQAVDALSIGASPSGCQHGEFPATVSMNSCSLDYGVSNVDLMPPHLYTGTLGIACSIPGDHIEVSFGGGCLATIAAQAPANSTAEYESHRERTEPYLDVENGSASNVSYTNVSGPCLLLGKNHSNGTLNVGSFTLHGS